MVKFIWSYLTAVFAVLYVFQQLHWMIFGVHMLGVALFALSFWLLKNQKTHEMIAANLGLVFVILVLWFSTKTFFYIQNGLSLAFFLSAVTVTQAVGGFWGRKFA
ncbi:hypothetical protein [Pseudolactococcus insecticola]|uniref:Uncharacterized protein n=1 Tax=Pseudolactococcus insecticola TaxID=2709158 RepID=A0A6A0B7E3_9LACT|nr:hypothetical protein [Lactococcus insecticola]GFH40583.1 hypothetical protein Hs20B_09810 [Lactococcus insecticola]